MADNFMRRYIMKCGPSGKGGFQIGNISSATETALHISFSIEKADVENPNDAVIQIWNLSDKNLKILESPKCIVELKAGYGDTMSVVLVGTVSSVITTKDNADRLTEITVVDGLLELKETVLSISMNGKVNSKEIYEKVAKDMGVPIRFAKDVRFKDFANGYTYIGLAKNILHSIAGYNKHQWTMENQVLQVTLPGRTLEPQGYLLSSETGLISVPKRVSIGNGTEEIYGWEVQYLLNGTIGINSAVQVKSSVVNGYFRVQKVTIDGDNLEGDWMCTAQLLEVQVDTELDKAVTTSSNGSSGASSSTSSAVIVKGSKVKVTRTFMSGNKKKGYTYTGDIFTCWYEVYDVIQIKGDRVVIGIGSTVTAAVNINDITKV